MTTKKDLMNEAFDGLLVSAVAVGISMAAEKILGKKLIGASTFEDMLKLAVGVTAGTVIVKYAQDKKWVPENPFKSN